MYARVNSSVTLHRCRVFELLKENITLRNGVTTDLEIINHPGASAIVPVSHDRTLLLIKQYRHAIGEYIWEIPAGTLNPDETPLECAKRELQEETGFSASTWEKLGEITPLPGYSNERIHIFLASDMSRARQKLDRDEMLDVHMVSIDNAFEMIHGGLIQDSKTISGLFMANRRLKGK